VDDARPRGSRAGSAARGGRRLTGAGASSRLQDALGLAGPAAPGEIKARYRALAQRAGADDLERLEHASLALAQELAHLGHDEGHVAATLVAEGCPGPVAATVARASAGPISRVVPAPLERGAVPPADDAYARLSGRLAAAESMRTATASSYGFGFVIRLALAFVVVIGALVAALDFFPRALRPAKVAPAPAAPAPYSVELLPPSPPPAKSEAR
jgi:hypothetical protein